MVKDIEERRRAIVCPKCKEPMVFMHKYSIFKGRQAHKTVGGWYICPNRKEKGEKGCGYKTLII